MSSSVIRQLYNAGCSCAGLICSSSVGAITLLDGAATAAIDDDGGDPRAARHDSEPHADSEVDTEQGSVIAPRYGHNVPDAGGSRARSLHAAGGCRPPRRRQDDDGGAAASRITAAFRRRGRSVSRICSLESPRPTCTPRSTAARPKVPRPGSMWRRALPAAGRPLRGPRRGRHPAAEPGRPGRDHPRRPSLS